MWKEALSPFVPLGLGSGSEEPGHGADCRWDKSKLWKMWRREETQIDLGLWEEWERECEVYFRTPWSAYWPRRTFLPEVFDCARGWQRAYEQGRGGTEAVIRPGDCREARTGVLPGWLGQLLPRGHVRPGEVTLAELLPLEVMTSAYSKNAAAIRTTCVCRKIKL